jgi:hypothetical protein
MNIGASVVSIVLVFPPIELLVEQLLINVYMRITMKERNLGKNYQER